MKITEEFKVSNGKGHEIILQHVGPGISYLDFGNTHLPRDFQGFRVKYTDRTAEPQQDGTFKLSNSGDIYIRTEGYMNHCM
ncbi:hypothetical protein Q8A64_18740 [Oxalobacteraceae bacterium R-40]|uniref:Uncharacterized protein n=1 Tax=Keguizhuia sedimenti TaxID=3064264 RepID=A0ABU1BTW0_9BURK|nr:hypothetical protein [Oxalobacteraceae bacterium R-40]